VATVQLARVSLTALLAGIAVSLVGAYAVLTVNYLVFAVFLTDFLVVLLALLGLPAGPTAIARLIGTGIGTGLAILSYLLWPTWEGTSAADKLARLFAAQGEYVSAILRGYTRPGGADVTRFGQLQLAARRARTDASASADRLAGEPAHGPMSAGLAQGLMSAAHRIAQAALTLGAAVAAHHAALARAAAVKRRDRSPVSQQDPDADLQPGLDILADGVSQATARIAWAMRQLGASPVPSGRPALRPLPQLRPMLQDLRTRSAGGATRPADDQPEAPRPDGDGAAPTLPHSEREGLFAAADSLVDAINAAAHGLRTSPGSH
jgi:uncharacterized membrane protein YccC